MNAGALIVGPLAALSVMMLATGAVMVRTPSALRRGLRTQITAETLKQIAPREHHTLRGRLPHLAGAWDLAVSLFTRLRRSPYGGRVEPWLARQLVRSGIALTPREILIISIGIIACGMAGGFLLWGTVATSGISGLATLLGLAAYVRRRQTQRLCAFGEQLPEMLSLLIISLRAGHSTMQALDTISRQVRAPASVEMSIVTREVQLGINPEEALRHLAERVNNEDLHLLINAIAIQHETGGNLISMVETIGETVRERVKIRGEVRALTAQAAMGGWIITLLPAVLGAFLFLVNPSGMSFFWTNWIGGAMGGVAICSVAVGNLVMRRIARIEL